MLRSLDHADWGHIPTFYRDELRRYIECGTPPASALLISILTNNLAVCIVLADTDVVAEIIAFLFNHCPSRAWGSGERVALWEADGGLIGVPAY